LAEASLIERFTNHRISFNITLLMVGVFATAAGGSPNHITLIALATMWSIGVGGNLPVDSSIFLGLLHFSLRCQVYLIRLHPEFIPASHQYLLTVLSIWWAFGQLLGSLVSEFSFWINKEGHNCLLGRLAFARKFLLSDHSSPFRLLSRIEHGLALLLILHGRSHDYFVVDPFRRVHLARESQISHGLRERSGSCRRDAQACKV
jgi:hypothetical protein